MKYTFIGNTIESYRKLELVRSSAYNTDYISNTYLEDVKEGSILMAGAYLDDKLVAGVFIASRYNSIYIEQLFVDKEYQKTDMHIGTNLLKFILDNKEEIEIYYDRLYKYSKLCASKRLEPFYEKLGYYPVNDLNMTKRI